MSDLSNLGYTTIVSYISFTFLFFVLKDRVFSTETQSNLWIVFFFMGGFLLLFFNNIYITSLKQFCGKPQMSTAFAATLFPWVFIFGIIILCIMIFPGWLRSFSNTFGFSAARAYGLKDVMVRIFSMEQKAAAMQAANQDYATLKAIETIYSDPTPFINELDLSTLTVKEYTQDGYEAVKQELEQIYKIDQPQQFPYKVLTWESLKNLQTSILKQPISQKDITELRDLVQIKDSVAYFIWFVMAGTITVLISTNSLLNSGCNGISGSEYDIIFNSK